MKTKKKVSKKSMKCDKCGGRKQTYYTLWCPRCDKPEPKIVKSLNFIKVLDHLVAIKAISKDDKYKFWDSVGPLDNDTSQEFPLTDMIRDWDFDEETDTPKYKVAKVIIEHFGDENYLWEISW